MPGDVGLDRMRGRGGPEGEFSVLRQLADNEVDAAAASAFPGKRREAGDPHAVKLSITRSQSILSSRIRR